MSELINIATQNLFFPSHPHQMQKLKGGVGDMQWQLFPEVASKCEYDETSVNKSHGKTPS